MKITVKVIAGAKENKIIEETKENSPNRSFKIKVNKIAENGLANEAVIELIADFFKIKKRDVKIILGATSKNKIIELTL